MSIKKRHHIIFVISAPSGTGKTTICDKLKDIYPDINFGISTTTRFPREGEKDGKDYNFIKKEEFERRMGGGEFVEWTTVLGNYYGTEHNEIEKHLTSGQDIILNINVDGAREIKKKYPGSVLIFVLPPSLKELEKRLKKRGSEKEKHFHKRIKMARHEINMLREYDYVLVNEDIDEVIKQFKFIIEAEKNKVKRYNVPKIIKKYQIEDSG